MPKLSPLSSAQIIRKLRKLGLKARLLVGVTVAWFTLNGS